MSGFAVGDANPALCSLFMGRGDGAKIGGIVSFIINIGFSNMIYLSKQLTVGFSDILTNLLL